MENTEQITKSNEFAKKHSITDNFLKWIVLFAMKNNLNQELMDNIFSSGSDAGKTCNISHKVSNRNKI